jgi:hypothetical protein
LDRKKSRALFTGFLIYLTFSSYFVEEILKFIGGLEGRQGGLSPDKGRLAADLRRTCGGLARTEKRQRASLSLVSPLSLVSLVFPLSLVSLVFPLSASLPPSRWPHLPICRYFKKSNNLDNKSWLKSATLIKRTSRRGGSPSRKMASLSPLQVPQQRLDLGGPVLEGANINYWRLKINVSRRNNPGKTP